jgi:molybdopterin converting factor small subunit
MERLVGGWLAARAEHASPATYTFGDFANEHTDEALVALATGAEESADTNAAASGTTVEAAVVVHLPGPLLALVGGADRIEVTAQTVGEALAAVAAENPAFGTTVMPDGTVAESFLIAVGDEDIRGLSGLATPVTAGTEITVVMAMSGG